MRRRFRFSAVFFAEHIRKHSGKGRRVSVQQTLWHNRINSEVPIRDTGVLAARADTDFSNHEATHRKRRAVDLRRKRREGGRRSTKRVRTVQEGV